MPTPPILSLGEKFYDPVRPAVFPQLILRHRNDAAAQEIGLAELSAEQWRAHFGRFEPLADNLPQPLALRYHGHQFRVYNPELGDGRGFLFAQRKDKNHRWLDLGTKGSGRTPYSRRGDGRLTLQGGVREVLASAYLDSLGVETSRALSLFETGEDLERHDEPSPARSAVLVRLSHSHIRFGTFQRAAYENNQDGLAALSEYCLRYLFAGNGKTPADLFALAVSASARTVAAWMAAGFVHGVMNTDNMNITGESFDYGPFRFLPALQAELTAAYFDHNGLYAFGRQPAAMRWNLAQLAQSLSLIENDQKLIASLETFEGQYRSAFAAAILARLGVHSSGDAAVDLSFAIDTFSLLAAAQCEFAPFFHHHYGGAQTKIYDGTPYKNWRRQFNKFAPAAAPHSGPPVTLIHADLEALWAKIAREDDWSGFTEKLAAIGNMLESI